LAPMPTARPCDDDCDSLRCRLLARATTTATRSDADCSPVRCIGYYITSILKKGWFLYFWS
ncbi:MAG: hypothetical protein ACP5I9_10160, partial [Candidatus Kapaibacteriota bacterium]